MAVSIAPIPHSLRSQKTGKKTYHLLVAEALDNSFDADALTATIVINQDKVEITDDGRGLTRENITAPFTEGHHVASSTTALGQFGVGITTQARKHGAHLSVDTVSIQGQRLKLQADWDAVEKSGSWLLSDPVELSQIGSRRTIISIGGLYKKPTDKDVERVREETALRFYPAIAAGKRIVINKDEVPLLPEPEMTDIVQDDINLGGGRYAIVRGGLLKNPSGAKLYGVSVSYRHRVIMANSGFGCTGYSGIECMFARVELNNMWSLTSFKDDLDDGEELADCVGEILEPVLKKCHGQSIQADVREALDDIYEHLGDLSARPQRNQRLDRRGEKRGLKGVVKIPAGEGPAFSSNGIRGGKIDIDFVPGKSFADNHGIGYVERLSKKSHRVKLPLENDRIAYWMKASRKDRGMALAELAIMLWRQSDPQQDIEGFGKVVAADLALNRGEKEQAA